MDATEAAEGERPEPVLEEHRAIVTYRHIQDRWGLGSPDAARVKARRAGWEVLPKNHPGDTTRLVIPRAVWDAAAPAAARSPGAGGGGSGIDPGERKAGSIADAMGSKALADAVDALREQHEHERERANRAEDRARAAEAASAEARGAAAGAEGRAAELAAAAAKAEADAAEQRRRREAVEAELARLKIERETVERLGFLGRLAWALRRP